MGRKWCVDEGRRCGDIDHLWFMDAMFIYVSIIETIQTKCGWYLCFGHGASSTNDRKIVVGEFRV